MKFCDQHWKELRDLVDASGFGYLVARSGEEATKRIVAELKGEATSRTFDPLMAAHNKIVENAIGAGGLAVMGDCCPLCFLVEHVTPCADHAAENCCDFAAWPRYAVGGVIVECERLGLKPRFGGTA